MAARASLLGDEGLSAPANWEAPLGTPEVHVLVMIAAAHQEALAPTISGSGRASSIPVG